MIPLERQVTSLESSKRLKELGIKQDSLRYWNIYITSKPYLSGGKQFEDELATDGTYIQYSVSAFTVAELGEILPYDIHSYKSGRVDKWCCCDNHGMLILRKTEADARAKMLIYLIENKLMGANE